MTKITCLRKHGEMKDPNTGKVLIPKLIFSEVAKWQQIYRVINTWRCSACGEQWRATGTVTTRAAFREFKEKTEAKMKKMKRMLLGEMAGGAPKALDHKQPLNDSAI